jgi:hypothetical protein
MHGFMNINFICMNFFTVVTYSFVSILILRLINLTLSSIQIIVRNVVPNSCGNKIVNNEAGGACSEYGREERRIHGFGEEN